MQRLQKQRNRSSPRQKTTSSSRRITSHAGSQNLSSIQAIPSRSQSSVPIPASSTLMTRRISYARAPNALRASRSPSMQAKRSFQSSSTATEPVTQLADAYKGKDTVRVLTAMYDVTGNPTEVMHLKEQIIKNPLPVLGETQVFVKTLASPINPADINLIEGTYGMPSTPPSIAGNEGVFEVIGAGGRSNLKPGDWVVPVFPGYGTWRSHVLAESMDFLKVPNNIASQYDVATLFVNPCTAWRMLEDFVPLKPGDVVVQNGANSAVGRNIIQFGKLHGLKTINIVRDRDNFHELATELRELGATVVLNDTQIKNRTEVKQILSEHDIKPNSAKLGINCVGGTAVADLCRLMESSGTVVTYGGMSKRPLMIGTGSLIFSDLTFKGFWMTRWNQLHPPTDEKRVVMLTKLFALLKEGHLKQQHDVHTITSTVDLIKAIDTAVKPMKKAKVVLDWSQIH